VAAGTLAPGSIAPPRSRGRSLWAEVWRHRLDYLFISPFFLIFGVFHAYPLGWALLLSFQRWSGFGDARWVGLNNYLAIVREDVVGKALVNTLIFTAILVPTGVLLSLVFAVILNLPNLRGRGVFRTAYFLPFITSSVIVGIVFRMLLDDSFGWVNVILKALGLAAISWLRTAIWAKVSIVLLAHWHGLGYNVLIMLGGLQSIPREVYEAAAIDGAGAYQTFWNVTLPLMRPVMLFVTLVGTIGVLNIFNEPFILTNGGPDAETVTLTFRLYELAFRTTRYGDAAALGFLIGALVVAITLTQLRVLRDWRQ
jgi:lactose/L-arabinose transport system permease protein